MKHLILRSGIAAVLFMVGLSSLQAQSPSPVARYKLEYDFCTNEYVAKVIPIIPLNNVIINTSSQYTIVIPGNVPGSITTTVPGSAAWSTGPFQVNYYPPPFVTPPAGETYRYWQPAGSGVISLPANIEYELFRFRYLAGTCLPGIRLYVNGVDYDDPSYGWFQYFVLNNSSDDYYLNNVSNASPSCSQYDFGDLTSLWGNPKAGMISPDCNGDGIPDNTVLGAVWAGNIIDAETTQNFSSQSTLANGDNIDGLNDEDGLTAPSTPMSLSTNYTFNVRLNSNLTGKQVFYGMWFDWNSDGNFNNDNATGTGPAFYSGSGTTSSPVDIPVVVLTPSAGGNGAGQAMPSYKIRLIASDVAVTSGMFSSTFSNGEVEDYAAPITILPIQLVSFTAQPQSSSVVLKWVVATETNVATYQIEYSSNGRTYASIGSLTATGSRNYSLTHTAPKQGLNYYRLKTIDKDGKVSYSEVRTVNFGGVEGVVKIYPIPASATVNITVTNAMINQSGTISIIALDGRLVHAQTTTAFSQTETINVSKLASGKYIVRIVTNNEVVNKRIEIVR